MHKTQNKNFKLPYMAQNIYDNKILQCASKLKVDEKYS